jgi:hypothetical protein
MELYFWWKSVPKNLPKTLRKDHISARYVDFETCKMFKNCELYVFGPHYISKTQLFLKTYHSQKWSPSPNSNVPFRNRTRYVTIRTKMSQLSQLGDSSTDFYYTSVLVSTYHIPEKCYKMKVCRASFLVKTVKKWRLLLSWKSQENGDFMVLYLT